MNKLLNILIAWCLMAAWSIPARAQFPSFPASNAFWLMEVHDGPTLLYPYGYHMKAAGHDTLINGVLFNTLWNGLEGQGGGFLGGIKSDADERVYYYHPNTDSTYLLYDFDAVIGDSMEVWVGDPYSSSPVTQWMYVESVDTLINNNGTMYKQIGIVREPLVADLVHWWVQGVGGTGGLLTTIGSLSVSLYTIMTCMQYNDSIWPYGGSGTCWPTGVLEHSASDLVIYPNPSQGLFQVAAPLPVPLTVLDVHGREVLHLPPYSREMDLSAQPPGVYTVVQRTSHGRSVQRLVVVK